MIVSSCRSDVEAGMVGRWESVEGYTLEIGKDGRYKFCDDGKCFTGDYISYNPSIAFSVRLMKFRDNEVGEKFMKAYVPYNGEPDLDVNEQEADINFPRIADLCRSSRCVSFGDSEFGNLAVLVKTG